MIAGVAETIAVVRAVPRRALGLDPGKTTGWGVVEIDRVERVVAFGLLDADPVAHLRELIGEYHPELVGIEIVEHVHPVRRGGISGISTDQALCLYRSGLLAGRFIETAEARVGKVALISAERWRSGVAARATASDGHIEQALRLRVLDFPKPRASNNHERDGIGVALFSLLDARLRAGRSGS